MEVKQATPSGGKEEETWVIAACQVLAHQQRPMHYLNIKQAIMEAKLVAPGLKTSLESALYFEIHQPTARVKRAESSPGVFELIATDVKPPMSLLQAKAQSSKVKVTPSQNHTSVNGTSDKYRLKYKRLRQFIKHMVFLNGAVCDEVSRVEEKIARVRDERRFLLKRLMQTQPASEIMAQMAARPPAPSPSQETTPVSTPLAASKPTVSLPAAAMAMEISAMPGEPGEKAAKMKKKAMSAKRKAKDALGLDEQKPVKVKKAKGGGKRLVQPIPLDSSGRPLFPIELGNLIVYSLGEIVNDRGKFHTHDCIYPAGFCSTRVYASLKKPDQRCLYTCKILDMGLFPQFEISPEDAPEVVISSNDLSECHSKLLQAINASSGREIVTTEGKGAEFFGLSHPTIQNLIQSCPGARKCASYKWVKFEVCKSEAEVPLVGDDDPVICFEALHNIKPSPMTFGQALEGPSSLRTLLTSGPIPQ